MIGKEGLSDSALGTVCMTSLKDIQGEKSSRLGCRRESRLERCMWRSSGKRVGVQVIDKITYGVKVDKGDEKHSKETE